MSFIPDKVNVHTRAIIHYEGINLDRMYEKGLLKVLDGEYDYKMEYEFVNVQTHLHKKYYFEHLEDLCTKSESYRKHLENKLLIFDDETIEMLYKQSDIYRKVASNVLNTVAYCNFTFYGMSEVESIKYDSNGVVFCEIINPEHKDTLQFPLFQTSANASRICVPIIHWSYGEFRFKGKLSDSSRVTYSGIGSDNKILRKCLFSGEQCKMDYLEAGSNEYENRMLYKGGCLGIGSDYVELSNDKIIAVPEEVKYRDYFYIELEQPSIVEHPSNARYTVDYYASLLPGIKDSITLVRGWYRIKRGVPKKLYIKKECKQTVIDKIVELNIDITREYGEDKYISYEIKDIPVGREICVKQFFADEIHKVSKELKDCGIKQFGLEWSYFNEDKQPVANVEISG